MNKKKLITIGILPFMWFLYFLFELITGRIQSNYHIFFNILMCVIFALTGYIIYTIGIKFPKGFSSKSLVILFFILFLLDQGGKLIIKLFFFHKDFYIIDNFLSFHPIINSEGSWLNARFGTNVSFGFLIFLNIIALIIFWEGYRYYKKLGHRDSWSDLCIVFIMAGCICSLIDKIFYGGSLDFIGISDLFIADLKDIYINLAVFLFILTVYFNGFLNDDEKSTLKDDIQSIKKFFKFIKEDIQSQFKSKN
ncbi:signal peptidase II [Clostridium fallax]|uniref:Signal peptidase II n=1 Tax=Clostridium fallax TaxID=1533 RepID=A0A1M4ZDM0_9CLOT|nr:signal peptidase II [Clostridium fallax]SHF16068.1 signal peptidase II [Clostridium fallax]SQB22219.1 signal peptidase (SPase) II [Clostridium fallax]